MRRVLILLFISGLLHSCLTKCSLYINISYINSDKNEVCKKVRVNGLNLTEMSRSRMDAIIRSHVIIPYLEYEGNLQEMLMHLEAGYMWLILVGT